MAAHDLLTGLNAHTFQATNREETNGPADVRFSALLSELSGRLATCRWSKTTDAARIHPRSVRTLSGASKPTVRASARRGMNTTECYHAAVEAWCRAHPDQARQYASQQAVEVVLRAKVSLRIEA